MKKKVHKTQTLFRSCRLLVQRVVRQIEASEVCATEGTVVAARC